MKMEKLQKKNEQLHGSVTSLQLAIDQPCQEPCAELKKVCTQPMFRSLEGIVEVTTRGGFKLSDVVIPILEKLGYTIKQAEPET